MRSGDGDAQGLGRRIDGIPIYSNDIAIGGSEVLIDALSAAPRLETRRATRRDVLDIDD